MKKNKILIIGSGIGGLASTLELAHHGYDVEVFETHAMPGGKMRTVDSSCGPIDAGPTVFTLKSIFDTFFDAIGEKIEDHLKLKQEPLLARHFWSDGSILDLSANPDENYKAIRDFGGQKSANEFKRFDKLTRDLYESFNDPILQSPVPSIANTVVSALKPALKISPALLPGRTIAGLVNSYFTNKKLRQLFSRYSTYVGGSPFNSPAILSLIWYAESLGVWKIDGGMHELAKKIVDLAEKRGAQFHFNRSVSEILTSRGKIKGIRLLNGEEIFSNYVIFNGDPNALFTGLLGKALTNTIARKNVKDRSLSAYVWTFAAKASLRDLAHHNVFFNEVYESEFNDIAARRIPNDPTLYICAQDIKRPIKSGASNRFEIIMNAAPISDKNLSEEEEFKLCQERTFEKLKKMGLSFDPTPSIKNLTTPRKFSQLFPASNGSLYGLNPGKFMTTFLRPTTQAKIQGLYLTGGGVHPGPGIPMALLSGRHAAAAIMKDQTSI